MFSLRPAHLGRRRAGKGGQRAAFPVTGVAGTRTRCLNLLRSNPRSSSKSCFEPIVLSFWSFPGLFFIRFLTRCAGGRVDPYPLPSLPRLPTLFTLSRGEWSLPGPEPPWVPALIPGAGSSCVRPWGAYIHKLLLVQIVLPSDSDHTTRPQVCAAVAEAGLTNAGVVAVPAGRQVAFKLCVLQACL